MNTEAFRWLAVLVGWMLPLVVIGGIVESRPGRAWMRRMERLSRARRAQAEQHIRVDYKVRDDYEPRSGWLVPR